MAVRSDAMFTPRLRMSHQLITGVVIGAVAALLYVAATLEPLERRVYDYRLRQSTAGSIDPSLQIVGFSQADLAPDGSPNPVRMREILVAADQAGAAVVVFNELPSGDPDALGDLAEAARQHGRVVFGYTYSPSNRLLLSEGKLPQGSVPVPRDLRDLNVAFGYRDRLTGPDGVLRRFTPTIGGQVEIGVAAAAAIPRRNVQFPRQATMVGEHQALGPGTRLLIRFDQEPRHDYPSSKELISGKLNLRDKTVLVGRTDREAITWRTPLGPTSDVEVTAQIASALITSRGITRAPIWVVVIAVLAVSLALIAGANQRRPFFHIIYLAGVGGLIWLLSGFAFRIGTWIDVAPLAAVLAGHLIRQPLLSLAALRESRPRPDRRFAEGWAPFFECLLETCLHGAFAHSGRVWVKEAEGGAATVAMRGEVPDHLFGGMPRTTATEASRDEGQTVFIPLRGESGLLGGLALLRRRGSTLPLVRLRLLERIADSFTEEFERARLEGLPPSSENALRGVARHVDEVDHFPLHHREQVAKICKLLGDAVAFSRPIVDSASRAAYLADLGKIGLIHRILDETGRLSDKEYEAMKRHPEVAAQILRAAGIPDEVVRAVETHHERWDGSGYPEKLEADSIPPAGRLLAVADAISAMISDRPYREGMGIGVALHEVSRQSGRMFDREVAEAATSLGQTDPTAYFMTSTDPFAE